MKIAGHGFDPGVGHANEGLAEICISEADRFEHSARRGAVTPIGDATTAMFGIHSELVYEKIARQRERRVHFKAEYRAFARTRSRFLRAEARLDDNMNRC